MSFNFSADSLEEIHKVLMMTLKDDFDFESAPRGKPIRELIGASFTLDNPRNRLIVSKARAVNYGFAVGELCWYVRGDSDLETMLYYNKRMKMFSDDGKTINSAYGARLLNDRFSLPSPPRTAQSSGPPLPPDSISQFGNVIRELRSDPDSRRAVMHVNEPRDLFRAITEGSKDVPCTMSLQLFIRERKLHMHVLMRSNDVVWGLPYDVFSFTCLQELFLYKLQEAGVPVDDLGAYHHTAGSLHIYDTHFAMAEEVSKESDRKVTQMKPMTLGDIEWLAESAEPLIRGSLEKAAIEWSSIPANPSFDLFADRDSEYETVDWMLAELVNHRDKRIYERREKGLVELVRLTEEAGGYPELEEKKENA